MAEMFDRMAMGWLPDYPDFRDYTIEHDRVDPKLQPLGQKDSVKAMLGKVRAAQPAKAIPPTVDLRAWCSPIENQLNLGSCTANAGWDWWSTLSGGRLASTLMPRGCSSTRSLATCCIGPETLGHSCAR